MEPLLGYSLSIDSSHPPPDSDDEWEVLALVARAVALQDTVLVEVEKNLAVLPDIVPVMGDQASWGYPI